MANKPKVSFVIFFAVIVLLLFQSTNVFAYTTYNNHVLNGGVGNYGYNNRYYFITSSASSYTSLIDSAMYDWVHTTSRIGITTPISFVKTSTQSSSVMDIYAGNYYNQDTGIIAETTQWTYSTEIDPWSTNWGWGKIELNEPVFDNIGSYNQKGSVSHEMGHVMGLWENDTNTSAVMCQLDSGRLVNNAQEDDANGINALY